MASTNLFSYGLSLTPYQITNVPMFPCSGDMQLDIQHKLSARQLLQRTLQHQVY